MTANVPLSAEPVRLLRQIVPLAAAFWALEFVIASLLFWTVGVDPLRSAVGKLILIAFNVFVTSGLTWVILTMRFQSFAQRALVALGLSLLCAPFYAGCDFLLQLLYAGDGRLLFDLVNFGLTTTYGLSLYFAWSCLILSLSFLRQARAAERALALAREEALFAQMQALRYQVNPHFLFNTLNSIAGLIEEGAGEKARGMALSLSRFMRTTLDMDPLTDVPLSREVALQQEYLEIEQERFPDRLRVYINLEPGCEHALVPNLILQPLVENAIKHGLGRSQSSVTLRISAQRLEGVLLLLVENDVPPDGSTAMDGMGIGIRNVASRLRRGFGDRASVYTGLRKPGIFEVRIRLPWREV